MKVFLLVFVIAAFTAVECGHTFLGTNVQRPLVYHRKVQYSSQMFSKRVENLFFSLSTVNQTNPNIMMGRTIQGILAYDLTNTGASANITQGGLGLDYFNLRMKSDRGEKINYDVYVYA